MAEVILIVDDEPGILTTLSGVLKDEGYQVATAPNGEAALRKIKEDPPSLVLLDIWMTGMDGIAALKQIKASHPDLPVLMMSGHGSIETAVKATKLGAYDYIEKPLSLEKVTLLIRHALHQNHLQAENLSLRQSIEKRFALIGESPAIQNLRQLIETAGASNSRILISGENGTGKELVARSIHLKSSRRNRPFVEINCAAIPDPLIESELFGHEKGAFTGADSSKKGRFEQADGATLFLDEIGDMNLTTQAKVLRVLQEQRFHRVGGTRPIEVDVRLIAASNKILSEEIKKGGFREDLYYRLNVIPLHVPPLREHREDIPLLANHFVRQISEEQGLKPKNLSPETVKRMMQYDWPGNVRELRNLIERLLIMARGTDVEVADLLPVLEERPVAQGNHVEELPSTNLREARAAFEREFILRNLKRLDWNISKTAEALQIERTYLHRKLKQLGIHYPSEE
jgi:two-component system, NtrC family, nitrogen regulation response regulator NtrX